MKKKRSLLFLFFVLSLLLCGCSAETGLDPVGASVEPLPSPSPSSVPDDNTQDYSYIRICELMTKNTAVLNRSGVFPDWVELHNNGAAPVDLVNCVLSDGSHSTVLPQRVLQSGEYLLLCSGESEGCLPFSLSSSDTLTLFSPEGEVLDRVSCEGCEKNQSLVFTGSGTGTVCLYPTPGYSNDDAGYRAYLSSLPLPRELRLNEVFVHGNSNAGSFDWVELYNAGEDALNLHDYALSDDGDELLLLPLPDVTLSPGEYYLCELRDTPFSLNGEKENLYLSRQGAVSDFVSLHSIPPSASYGRDENGLWCYLEMPTPGTGNGPGFLQVAEAPVCRERDGVFSPGETVTVRLEAAGEIYYTTDCTDPETNGQLYTSPLLFSENTVLRAVAKEEGKCCSACRVYNFFFEDCSLPIVSLVGDDPAALERLKQMPSQEPEIRAFLSLYEEDGGFSLPCGVRLSGNYSLKIREKSFKVYFRSAYGADALSYDVFDTGITNYHSLGLRKGMDSHLFVYKNELFESLAMEFSDRVAVQNSKFCRMYINGQYWGLVSLRDDFSSTYYSETFGGSKDSVSYERFPLEKDSVFYQQVYAFTLKHRILNEQSYQELSQMLDIESVIDWILIKGLSGDKDYYPNVAFFRSEGTDGLWRMAAWDFDWGFSFPFCNLTSPSDELYYSIQLGNLLSSLFSYEPFRIQFLERLREALALSYTKENILAKMDAYETLLASEVAVDWSHWNVNIAKWDRLREEYRNIVSKGIWHKQILPGVANLPGIRRMNPASYMTENK